MPRLAALCKTEKPRVLLDAVAGQHSAEMFTAMPARARWVIYGKLESEAPVLKEAGQFIFMGKRIEGYWLMNWFRKASIVEKLRTLRAVQNRFVSGAWNTEVVATVRLADVMRDLPDAVKLGDGKIMIVP
jgi:NADPH:quinone reductase-like Zn-dependent oxidoreductase